MKKISCIFASFLALVGMVACSKNTTDVPAEKIKVTFGISGPGLTRATGVTAQSGRNDSADEAKVNTLDVFVFNGDVLDGHASVNSVEATVSCTAGARQIYAVVNNSAVSGITKLSDLLAVESVLAVSGDSPSNFQMIGHTTATLQADGRVTIPVDRFAARVVIRKITNGFDNDAQAASFVLKSVYLTNATGKAMYGGSEVADQVWYNRRGYEASNNLGSYTYDEIAVADGTVAKGASYETAHFFYTMPNGFDAKVGLAAGETAFTPRAVRLLVRAEIGGELYNYPIAITGIQSNKSYEINELVITRLGNKDDGRHDPDDPDDDDEERPIVGFDQGFTITVNDWTVELVNGGTITI